MAENLDQYKAQAAQAAVDLVKSGMVVGLGHGSTTQHALEALAAKLEAGELADIVGVPCSKHVENEAGRLGIPIKDIDEVGVIDITIDGADEVDPNLNLIKGGGGALLREKVVAQASQREVIIVDYTKQSHVLGSNFPLPVEVEAFGWRRQVIYLQGLGANVSRRERDGKPVLSDQGNYLLDCDFGSIDNLYALATALEGRAGILEHGLFLNLATDLIVAGPEGLQRKKAP